MARSDGPAFGSAVYLSTAAWPCAITYVLIICTQKVFRRFANVNSLTNSSTYPLLLLI
jgi:hypothetical protein